MGISFLYHCARDVYPFLYNELKVIWIEIRRDIQFLLSVFEQNVHVPSRFAILLIFRHIFRHGASLLWFFFDKVSPINIAQ